MISLNISILFIAFVVGNSNPVQRHQDNRNKANAHIIQSIYTDYTKQVVIQKCCGVWEMLDSRLLQCVMSPWSRESLDVDLKFGSRVSQPPQSWLAHWLPPGLKNKTVYEVAFNNQWLFKENPFIMSVNSSTLWEARGENAEATDEFWARRIVLDGPDIIRPVRRTGRGVRQTPDYCADAALPPQGPFVLVYSTKCARHECAYKCCERGFSLQEQPRGRLQCIANETGYWSPLNSSFAQFLDSETPMQVNSDVSQCKYGTFNKWDPVPENQSFVDILLQRRVEYYFSSGRTCAEFESAGNGQRKEVIGFCLEPRHTRAMYWITRPITFLGVVLLLVCLASVLCNSQLRTSSHGGALGCHAFCLLAFNLGQLSYYFTISDEVDFVGGVPRQHEQTCEYYGFVMYFLLMAAGSWLTALCFNMSRRFRKSQWGRPFKDSWRRFLYISAFGWGCPLVLTTTCALVFKRYDALKLYSKEGVVYYSGPWFRPSLIETRTCFNEIHHRKDLKGGSSKYGSLLFYYTPILALVIANLMCLGSTAQNIRRLSRGNSILRRDEVISHSEIRSYHEGTDVERNLNGTCEASGLKIRRVAVSTSLAHADSQSILVYLKLLLAAGALEFLTEAITWAVSGFHGALSSLLPSDEETSMFDHTFVLRTVGYFVDIVRACGVLWLAFPKSRRTIAPLHLWTSGQTTWYSAM